MSLPLSRDVLNRIDAMVPSGSSSATAGTEYAVPSIDDGLTPIMNAEVSRTKTFTRFYAPMKEYGPKSFLDRMPLAL